MIYSYNQHFLKPFLFFFISACLFACQSDLETESLNNKQIDLEDQFSIALDIINDDPIRALEICDKVLSQAESQELNYYSGKAKWYKAYIYDEIIQNVSEAYFYYNEALKDLNKTDSSSLKMKVYSNLGVLYRYYSQYDAAIRNYESALELSDDLTKKQLSDLYYNYGVALKLKGDSTSFFDAENAFTKSMALARAIDDHENIASGNNQIGLMYKSLNDYDMSRIAYKNTIRTYQSNPELAEYVGKAYHGIGVTYMEEENYSEAITAFERALHFKKSSGSIFTTKFDLGTVLVNAGFKDEAIKTWKSALLENHDKNQIEQVQIYSSLSNALASKNQYEEAFSYSQIFNSNIEKIIDQDLKYQNQSNHIFFADIIREYDEFNNADPLYANPRIILLISLLLFTALSLVGYRYYRSGVSRQVNQTIESIQSQFHQIKVD